MYDMLCTRLEISFAIGTVSLFQSNLGLVQSQAVRRIFRYLRGSDFVLCNHHEDLCLTSFSDINWAGEKEE